MDSPLEQWERDLRSCGAVLDSYLRGTPLQVRVNTPDEERRPPWADLTVDLTNCQLSVRWGRPDIKIKQKRDTLRVAWFAVPARDIA